MNKILKIFIFISIFFIGSVYASNDVDYNLTITKNYDFNEKITFSLTNSKSIDGGNNPFFMIANDDVYSDISYQNKYKKKTYTKGNKTIIELSHTYSEYGLNNANFLNNCFETAKYDYDKETISFTGSNFTCLDGDSIKISVITDFEVTTNNANNVVGNKYTWNAKNSNFGMNIEIKKPIQKEQEESNAIDNDYVNMNDEQEEDSNNEENISSDVKDNKKSISPILIFVIIGIALGFGLIIFVVLHAKSRSVNKI